MTKKQAILLGVAVVAAFVVWKYRDKLIATAKDAAGALNFKPISIAPATTRTQQVVGVPQAAPVDPFLPVQDVGPTIQ